MFLHYQNRFDYIFDFRPGLLGRISSVGKSFEHRDKRSYIDFCLRSDCCSKVGRSKDIRLKQMFLEIQIESERGLQEGGNSVGRQPKKGILICLFWLKGSFNYSLRSIRANLRKQLLQRRGVDWQLGWNQAKQKLQLTTSYFFSSFSLLSSSLKT